ncbi:MAG: endonuclease V [candidate division WOR-3 bacterium]
MGNGGINLFNINSVAGCDVAYDERDAYAVWVVLSFPELKELEKTWAHQPIPADYHTGYLAHRELPPLLSAFAKLKTRPDVVICDAAGKAHPRKFGLACALGKAIDIPTIGCAKRRLVEITAEPASERGSYTTILMDGEAVGVVLRTRAGVKPVYVSPGYKISVDEARQIVLSCCRRWRIPEPIRFAHHHALLLRQGFKFLDVKVNYNGLG